MPNNAAAQVTEFEPYYCTVVEGCQLRVLVDHLHDLVEGLTCPLVKWYILFPDDEANDVFSDQ